MSQENQKLFRFSKAPVRLPCSWNTFVLIKMSVLNDLALASTGKLTMLCLLMKIGVAGLEKKYWNVRIPE